MQHDIAMANSRKNVAAKMKKSGHYFVQHTSIRGLPKIVKSEDRFLKIIWTLFSCISFCVLLLLISKLIVEYSKYATTTQLREISSTDEFPAVTICYDMPLFEKFEDDADPNTFRKQVNNIIEKEYFKHAQANKSTNLRVHDIQNLNTISHFIETNYAKTLRSIESVADKLAEKIKCTYTKKDGRIEFCETINYPDSTGYHIETNFFHCFTLKIPSSEVSQDTAMTVTLNLTVAEEYWKQRENWFGADFQTHTFGYGETVTLMLHQHKEHPWMSHYGTRVMLNNLIQVSYTRLEKIAEHLPNYPCKSDEQYSQMACRLDTFIELMREECSCSPRAFHLDHRLCGNLSSVWHQLEILGNLKRCREIVRKKTKSYNRCPRACREQKYTIDQIFTMPWKKTDSMKNLQGRIAEASKIQKIFDLLSEDPAEKTTSESQVKLQSIMQCADNRSQSHCADNETSAQHAQTMLMHIMHVPARHDFQEKETLVITQSSFLSQIGGMCSLFVGLTFTVIAELVETLYLTFFKKNSSKVELPPSLLRYEIDQNNQNNRSDIQPENV